jgi:sterol desaturase/sphingolipid hydroxylase (fatty acid hydroxylase superfamily)
MSTPSSVRTIGQPPSALDSWTPGGLRARWLALPTESAHILLASVCVFISSVIMAALAPTFLTDLATFLGSNYTSIVNSRTAAVYVSPLFWGIVALILAVEALWPAEPEQPILCRGLAVDIVYFVTTMLFRAVLVSAYIGVLKVVYDRHLQFLTIGLLADLPAVPRLAVSILVIDFLGWWNHFVRHRVPVLWRIHAVHHSQEQLNLFTTFRNHPLDYVASVILVSLPLFMTGSTTTEAFVFSFVAVLHTMFTHANVRWGLGPLKYLLVTPQSHRVHHSTSAEHYGTNLGVTFSIWDWLFGTAHRGSECPPVGLGDPTFPLDRTPERSVLRTLALQWAYPLRRNRSG